MRLGRRLEAQACDVRSCKCPPGYPGEMELQGKNVVKTSLAVLFCLLTVAIILSLLSLCGI